MAGDLQFKFAILVAGFKSRSTSHDVYYSTQIKFPTLHVFGDTDKVIPKGACKSTGEKAMGKEILQYLILYQLRHKADFMLLEHVFVFAQNHLS